MFRKLITVLLIFIFIPLFLLEGLLFNIWDKALRSDIYKQNLEEHKIYDLVYDYVLPQFIEKSLGGELPIPKEKVGHLLGELFPKSYLKKTTQAALDDFFNYIRGESKPLEIKISLIEFKAGFIPKVEKVLTQELEALPPCNREQLKSFEEDIKDFPKCLPPDVDAKVLVGELEKQFWGELETTLEEIPDTFDVVYKLGIKQELAQIRQGVSRLFYIIVVFLFGLILILGLEALLLSYSLSSLLRGIGITLFLSGLVSFLTVSLLRRLIFEALGEYLSQALGTFPLSVKQNIFLLLYSLFSTVATPIIYQMLIIFSLGAVLVFISFIVNQQNHKVVDAS